jgi:hypothetical protein
MPRVRGARRALAAFVAACCTPSACSSCFACLTACSPASLLNAPPDAAAVLGDCAPSRSAFVRARFLVPDVAAPASAAPEPGSAEAVPPDDTAGACCSRCALVRARLRPGVLASAPAASRPAILSELCSSVGPLPDGAVLAGCAHALAAAAELAPGHAARAPDGFPLATGDSAERSPANSCRQTGARLPACWPGTASAGALLPPSASMRLLEPPGDSSNGAAACAPSAAGCWLGVGCDSSCVSLLSSELVGDGQSIACGSWEARLISPEACAPCCTGPPPAGTFAVGAASRRACACCDWDSSRANRRRGCALRCILRRQVYRSLRRNARCGCVGGCARSPAARRWQRLLRCCCLPRPAQRRRVGHGGRQLNHL